MKKVLVMSVVFATLVWTMGLGTFVASAATLSASDLIKGSGPAVYYYAADGKRYTFPTLSTYMTWYSDFSKVKTITDSELAAISLAGNVVVRAGTKLVKIDTVPKVFAVEPKGKLVWVASEAVANTLFGADWAKRIITIPDGFWTNYTDSGLSLNGTTYPEGQLVKWAGSANVYYVTGGKKSLVSTDTAFAANMWKTADVVTAPAAITLSDGSAISAAVATLVDVSQGGGAGSSLPTGGTGTLTVALAGDTPAASPVAKLSTANFLKFGLTANGAAMTVSKVVLTKGGYSGTGDLENIKITDLSGVALTNSTSLNTNGTATLTFSPALSLAAGETRYFFVRAGVKDVNSGLTASFAVAGSSDVTSSAATVAGNFPVLGNAMSVVAVEIGSARVYEDGAVTNTTPDAGDTNVVVNKFKVEAGTTEAITLESITVMEAGDASLSDVKNIELWDVTANKSLGEVAAWNANGKASFTGLNIVIGKGEIHRFQVRLDIVSGAGLSVNSDITDGDDVLMSVKGNSYGFYITPAVQGGWVGKGAADQVINAGNLLISKSPSTPATGKIAEAADQLLAIWNLEAKGEEINVSRFKVHTAYTGNGDGADLISCKLLDENGGLVAGPTDDTDAYDYVNFTDTFVVPVGVHKYSFKCRVFDSDADDFGGAASYKATVTPSADLTAKGVTTNDSVDFAAQNGAVSGNPMSVANVKLAVLTLGTPAAQLVAAGTGDYIWATFSMDAENSGEDVNVTGVELTDTVTVAGNGTDIDNVEVWCDLAGGSSERGDVYEKKVSDLENFTGAGVGANTLALDFTETISIAKNSFVKCAVVADLNSAADANDEHTINVTDVTASGANTGATPGDDINGAGQKMTVAGNGTLTVSVDASSPKAAIFVSTEQKQTLAVFRLQADSVESLDLDELKITDDGNTAGAGVGTYYFYSNKRADSIAVTEPIATKPGAAAVTAVFPDGRVTVPSGGYVLITVKGDIAYIDGTTVDNANTVEVTIAAGNTAKTTGLSSGLEVTGAGANYDAATHKLFEARPVVTKDSSSPSGSTLTTGSTALVAVFKIDNTAGTRDIVMDDTSTLKIKFSGSSSGGTCNACTVTLKDKDGNTMGTDVTVDLSGAVSDTAEVTFPAAPNQLTVTAGDYQLIKVYANTTDFNTAGDSLQVSLEDGADANFTWSIDSPAGGSPAPFDAYSTATISFRGNVYANTLGK